MGTFDQLLSTITYPLRVPFEIVSWLQKASKNYGIMVLLLAITCYTYIGLRTYVDTTFAWFGQYMYGIQPGDIEAGIAISTMPWSFKMIYGLIFDNIPIMRRHTKPYLLVASALGVAAFAALSFDLFVPTWISFIAFVLVLQIGGAATDVLIDGLVVISGRESESGSSADLQVLSYASTGAGVIIGDLLGSFFAKPYETEGSKRLAQFKNKEVSESFVYNTSTSSIRWYFRVMGIFPMFMFLLAIMQREPKSTVNISVRPILSNLAKLFKTLLLNPVVLKPMLWVYIYNMSKIKMTGSWKLYYTQVLGLTTMDLGYLNTGAAIFYIIGILSYGRFFMRVSYRKLFFWSQVFAIFIAFLSYAVVRRWNVTIGIPDFWFLMLTNCAEQMLGKLNSVPFLILAAQFCPKNMENTFFALLMSLFNFSDIQIPSIWSKAILDKFNIQGGNFTQFPTVVLINLFMGFIPLLLIFMVPTYSAILTTEERVELGLPGDSGKKINDSIDSSNRDQEITDDKV